MTKKGHDSKTMPFRILTSDSELKTQRLNNDNTLA